MRPANDHTPWIHAFLRQLRASGFDGVPEPVAIDPDGRERLVIIPGEVALPPYPDWSQTDAALASVVRLFARFQAAAHGFHPPPGATWSQELAGALLDFDFAAPGRPLCDLAAMARRCIPLATAEASAVLGWTPFDPFQRLRLVADSYGLPAGRVELVDLIELSMARARAFVQSRVVLGEPEFLQM